jgi:hypothetical protein
VIILTPAATVGAAGLPGTPATVDTEVGAASAAGAVKVNEAVPVCVPWVAVTVQVPATVAVSEASVTAQPVLVVTYVTALVTDPPALVRVMVDLTSAVAALPDTVNGDVAAAATAAKVNVTAALVFVPWVAVTVHVTGAVAVAIGASDVPVTVQLALDANATVPVLDPPTYVRVIGLRTVPVRVVFDTESVASAAPAAPDASPRMTGAPASAALPPEPPHPARRSAAHAMTAPAAFPLRLLERNPLNRLLRALMVGRASPGLCPIIVPVSVTIGHGGGEHYRVNTVFFQRVLPDFVVLFPISRGWNVLSGSANAVRSR